MVQGLTFWEGQRDPLDGQHQLVALSLDIEGSEVFHINSVQPSAVGYFMFCVLSSMLVR